jgi:energy-converting hydrogenase Eha subunit A
LLLSEAVSNEKIIVGVSLAVIGAIIAAVFLGLYFLQRKKAQRRGDFYKYKQESKTI